MVRIKDLRLGEETPEEEKQLDVALGDLGDVQTLLEKWAVEKALAKKMNEASVA
jgi:hypothetical protein